jgi:CheY-like chemotaxis protein
MIEHRSVLQGAGNDEDLAPAPRLPSHFRILLIEDNPADIDLIQESFAESEVDVRLEVASTGEVALDLLKTRTPGSNSPAALPQLILLDLNLPGMHGHQVLAEIKDIAPIRHIPVVVLSSSEADHDITDSYALGASCYLAKPLDFDAFRRIVRGIERFWFSIAKLPRERLEPA